MRGLLSRIGEGDAGVARPERKADEVAEPLRVLLNSRHGDAVTVSDFGLVDFTDLVHNFPDAIHTLSRAIRETIETYEPRLEGVSIREVPSEDPLVLRFEITAHLVGDGSTLRFRTRVTPGGQFDVL